MLEFVGSPEADSLNEFEGHYCQVLIAELLFKNDYGQSNREEVLKAVGYFDSIDDGFLAARAHYMNGVGYYEQGDLVNACTEYLNTLRIMESHFDENELVGKKARFMALTYNRLLDLFKSQLMPEPAIYCARQSLIYTQIAPTSLNAKANILYQIGLQHDILREKDSAVFYYEAALNALHDRNTMVYRDLMASRALFDYCDLQDTIKALDSLKSMVAQAESESERITRYSTIGYVYNDAGQLDSAKVYKELVFEFAEKAIDKKLAAKTLHDIAISEGDTLKANQYAQFLIEDVAAAAENQAQVSKLNDLFQNYLQEKQEAASLRERRKAVRLTLMVLVPLLLAIGLAVAIVMRRRHRKRLAAQEADAQRRLEEERQSHRMEQAALSGRLKRSNETLRELQDQVRQQNETTPKPETQAASFAEEPICRLIMERVNEGQFKSQMDCKLYKDYALGKEQLTALREAADRHFNQFTVRLAKAYPNLTKGDLDYCCLYLLGLSDADISALMQRAYATVSERSRKIKTIFGTEEPLSVALMSFANGSASI
jgi:tetratricopeptide (TPR) repeat protein